ncbi:hypothetical protein ACFVMC_16525 [Nocardia sp. NPDC127579]|uniref:hypothetical protein n=1 Tax=Nocardia sp. NPDC127579 TaxID=3345402 RepID=UPI0036290DD4
MTTGTEASIESVLGILDGASKSRRTAILRVTGEPGGEIRLQHGMVIAVDSPGAPGVAELLARPGRPAPGSAELRILHFATTLDAAFAVASGWIGDCFWVPAIPRQPDIDPIAPHLLATETTRRLRGVAGAHLAPHRNHLARTAFGDSLLRGGASRELLARVNGRRTCRDLAFLRHRGLYATTVEVTRLLAENVVTVTDRDRGHRTTTPALPRRRRDASGINDLYPPGHRVPEGKP